MNKAIIPYPIKNFNGEDNMKNKTRVLVYAISIILTLLAMHLAYIQRGYLAIGGEVLLLLIPVLIDIWVEGIENEEE